MFDSQALLHRLGGDRQLLDQLLGIYLAEAPKLVAEARAAMTKLDWNTAGFAVHNLRGLAANVGFAEVGAVAEKLERQWNAASDTDRSVGADEIMQKLADAVEQSSEQLKEYLHDNP